MSGSNDQQQARKGRQTAIVIAVTALLWVVVTFLGTRLGLGMRVLALFDLMALAGFVWALWMTWQIWRARQDRNTNGQG